MSLTSDLRLENGNRKEKFLTGIKYRSNRSWIVVGSQFKPQPCLWAASDWQLGPFISSKMRFGHGCACTSADCVQSTKTLAHGQGIVRALIKINSLLSESRIGRACDWLGCLWLYRQIRKTQKKANSAGPLIPNSAVSSISFLHLCCFQLLLSVD